MMATQAGPRRSRLLWFVGASLLLALLAWSVWFRLVYEPSVATTGEPSVTRRGVTSGDSAPFTLWGGRYRVAWRAESAAASRPCHYGAALWGVPGDSDAPRYPLGNDDVPSGGVKSGDVVISQVPSGQYVVAAVSDCAWSVTFTAVP